eukprot:840939-Rhodomonas_salina.3
MMSAQPPDRLSVTLFHRGHQRGVGDVVGAVEHGWLRFVQPLQHLQVPVLARPQERRRPRLVHTQR